MPVIQRPVLETYDANGRMYRHPLAFGRRWSTYYGAEGSGFGFLTWREDREVGRDYADLGFLQRAIVRKGLTKVLFDGRIVGIEERRSSSGDAVAITAAGWGEVFQDTRYNYVYSDERTSRWQHRQGDRGLLVPSKFDVDTDDRIYVKPRRNTEFEAGGYTVVRYSFPYGNAERIAFSAVVSFPWGWPGKAEVRDDRGQLWSSYVTTNTNQVIAANDEARCFEARFTVTIAGENTAVEDTCYFRLSNVVVYGSDKRRITPTIVARDLVSVLEAHGIAGDTTRIVEVDRALPDTVAFESDWTPKQILDWMCAFGDRDDDLLAWGVEMNDQRRFFLERQDLETLKYVVGRSSGLEAETRGDWTKSAQKVYGVYRDIANRVQRTADLVDQGEIDRVGGGFRRVAVGLDGNLDAVTAARLLALELEDRKKPETSTSFTVSDRVYTAQGKAIAIDEVQARGMVRLEDFRAREVSQETNDTRTQWTSFQLVGVEIDEDAGTARLIPAKDRRQFEQFLARMAAEE